MITMMTFLFTPIQEQATETSEETSEKSNKETNKETSKNQNQKNSQQVIPKQMEKPIQQALRSDLSQLKSNEVTIEHTPPIYWGAKAAVAVPANASEDVLTVGPSMGIFMDNNNAMGMRVIYMDSPPENPLAEYTPQVNMAWGPVVDWQYLFQPNSGFSFYTQAAVGFVYGTPIDSAENNVVLPIIEGGFGARLSRRTKNGGRFYFSPELGFVPGAVAPYMSASFGYVAPAKTERFQ